MLIRPAQAADSERLGELIFSSAAHSLTALFTLDPKHSAKDFLHQALRQAEGQYGYANHWVADDGIHVQGAICAWHDQLSLAFHHATFDSVHRYYGLLGSAEVFKRSQLFARSVPPPQAHECCIGHLAVKPTQQRRGIATMLVHTIAEQAARMDKTHLSLDVESDNQAALAFYAKLGFEIIRESVASAALQQLGIGNYLHLSKAIP
ncbi:MAG: GNAT family N-acetyltransferase [Paraglaciecola sp.]|nr:GNAT family N-acetyltransferase [Paraglaciecola sp.]NCT49704.1 GNAT family N-acetyltransferase [Paraglaciecola sp.]